MPRIEGLSIHNYRSLAAVSLGTATGRSGVALPPMLAVIGPNGSGKSSFIDAFGFLGDCLSVGVEEASDQPHRGGFERLRTRGRPGPMRFELAYRQTVDSSPILYTLEIDSDADGRPTVTHERLQQRRVGATRGRYFSFLDIKGGAGYVWAGDAEDEAAVADKIRVRLDDPRRLGITVFGNLTEHPRIVAFRQFLEGWYLSYFVPELARGLPMAGAQKHLNRRGDNLANYVQYLEKQHAARFGRVLARIARKIPGVEKISAARSQDGRLLLSFNDRGFQDPFYAQDMSDGTLKMFAYLLLLEDPDPAPLIGIEEPENGLHHKLLQPLATEMLRYADQPNGPQIIVTTHSPYFVDGLRPEQVFVIEKDVEGYSEIRPAGGEVGVTELFEEGIPLGSLWFSEHFGRLRPDVPSRAPSSRGAAARGARRAAARGARRIG